MAAVGLQRLCLKNLNTKITNSLIVGIIIGKQPCRIFPNKKDGPDRGVLNFTLRDSETDYINVTMWGSREFVERIEKSFYVGDVVDVMNGKIEIRHIDDNSEQYRPAVTSPFSLTMNENQSSMVFHDGDNYGKYIPLLHLPTKPVAGCLTLADVHNNGGTIRGDLVDLLVVVKHLRQIRTVQLKRDGKETKIRDVVVMDQTNPGLTITLWEIDFIRRSEQWKARETVLFLADMRVDWSKFQHSMVAVFTSRTIVTEDPEVPAAGELRRYAGTAPFHITAIFDHMVSTCPDPSTIRNVMTCQHVLDKACIEQDPDEIINLQDQHFTALLFVFVVQLDLDGFTRITTTRCGRCGYIINEAVKVCINLECPVGSGAEQAFPETNFDIKITLADHTGQLEGCKLVGQTAEKMLGVTVQEFLLMSDSEKAALKWKFLLERCAIHIFVMRAHSDSYPLISILRCIVADPEEIASKLPLY